MARVHASLQEVDRLEDSELVPIMTNAIKPEWLRDTIVMKIATGKGPNLVGHATKWRRLAKEQLSILVTVIRENAEMAEMLRGTDELSRWILPAPAPTAPTTTSAPSSVSYQGMPAAPTPAGRTPSLAQLHKVNQPGAGPASSTPTQPWQQQRTAPTITPVQLSLIHI